MILIPIEIEILIQSGKSKIHKPQACFGRRRENNKKKKMQRYTAYKRTHIHNVTIIINSSSNNNKFQNENDKFRMYVVCASMKSLKLNLFLRIGSHEIHK